MKDRELNIADLTMDLKTRFLQLSQPCYSWFALNQHGSAETSAQQLQSPVPGITQDIREGSSSISRAQHLNSVSHNPRWGVEFQSLTAMIAVTRSLQNRLQRQPVAVGIWSWQSFSLLQSCLPISRSSFPLPLLLACHEVNKQILTSYIVHIKWCALFVKSFWD